MTVDGVIEGTGELLHGLLGHRRAELPPANLREREPCHFPAVHVRLVTRVIHGHSMSAEPEGGKSRQRGGPSNHQLPAGLRATAISLVRERYADFGPAPDQGLAPG